MKYIAFSVPDLMEKARTARADVLDLDQLRTITPPAEGTSFIISQMIFIWVGADKTPDDGLNSVKPKSLLSTAAGRYRRAGLAPRSFNK